MTEREKALMSYIATIAFTPHVTVAIASKSTDRVISAVLACVREDLGAVAARIVENGVRAFAKRVVEPVARDFFDEIAHRVGDVISGKRR